jgi:hypothetical protein
MKGEWTLSVGQNTYPVEISYLNNNDLMLTSTLEDISGRYIIQDNKMTMLNAIQPRISGVIFELSTANHWIITKSPTTSRLTNPILGATLVKK